MNSFALWFSAVDEKCINSFKADVHFNLWNLHYKQAIPPSLDVGVKIPSIKECKSVHFFVPFVVIKSNIFDLGKTLKTSEILCSVFNEDYAVSHHGGNKIVNVTNSNNESIMNIYCLDIDNDLKLENKYGGTILSFNCSKKLSESPLPAYFRFRIQSKEFKQIIKCYNPQKLFLQSAVSTTEAIDFRFNDYRSLQPTLLEEMRAGISYSIGKVHFLLLTEADVDLQYSSTNATARELENNVWKGYFKNLFKINIVAYHWKFVSAVDSKLIENCIMFVKTKVHKCNWKTIMIYIAALGIFTLFFNFVSSLLFGR